MELKNLRVSRKLSQRELASLLKVAPNTLSQWERGLRNPDPNTLKEIADFFDVSLDYLLGRTTTATNKKTPDADATSVSDEEYSMILQYRMLTPLERADVRGYINGKVSSSQSTKDEQLPQNIG